LRDPDERFHWFLYTIILAQFIVIAILLGQISNEYLSNAYMQTWVKQNAPGLEILLNGNLDVMLIGAGVGLTFLLIQHRRDATRTIPFGQADSYQTAEPTPTTSVLELAPKEKPARAPSPPSSKRSRASKQAPDHDLEGEKSEP
jgi:hypothetical protein